jgi:type I restriction enzyme, R subunit
VDGKPISAEEFLKRLFDTIKLPEILGSEEQLRKVWSNPITRRELIQKLEKAGCYKDDLLKLQELISAENSDLFDVLEYIAYLKAHQLVGKQELRLQRAISSTY